VTLGNKEAKMTQQKRRVIFEPPSDPDITTIKGLKKEVVTAVVRYFAPVVAIYEALETTAGMPTAWQQKKLDEDHPTTVGE
jgi:hypothetical protein